MTPKASAILDAIQAKNPFAGLGNARIAIGITVSESLLLATVMCGAIVTNMLVEDIKPQTIAISVALALVCSLAVMCSYLLIILKPVRRALRDISDALMDGERGRMSPDTFTKRVFPLIWRVPVYGFLHMIIALFGWLILFRWVVLEPSSSDSSELEAFQYRFPRDALPLMFLFCVQLAVRLFAIGDGVHLVAWRTRWAQGQRAGRILSWLARVWSMQYLPIASIAWMVLVLFWISQRNAFSTPTTAMTYGFILAAVYLSAWGIRYNERIGLGPGELALIESIAANRPGASDFTVIESFLDARILERRLASVGEPLARHLSHLTTHSTMAIRDAADQIRDETHGRGIVNDETVSESLSLIERHVGFMEQFAERAYGLLWGWGDALHGASEKHKVDLREAAQSAYARLGYPRNVRLRCPDQSVWCYGSRSMLTRAVEALLDNARLATRHLDLTESTIASIDIEIVRHASKVLIVVRDRGTGLLPALRERAPTTGPYRSNGSPLGKDPVSGYAAPFVWNGHVVGLGLGLCFVDTVAVACGGRLLINVEPGGGWSTSVTLELPGATN